MDIAPDKLVISIRKKKLQSLTNDHVKCAEAVNLIYVNDRQSGISRVKKGDIFIYLQDNKLIKDKAQLQRIKSLVLPPAWKDVWICADANGHLQATGTDAYGRKQYKYHPLWNALRSQTKFFHLYDFGNALGEIRKKVRAHLALQGLPAEKVLATIVSLMEHTGIRVGNSSYEQQYGSYGVTTLKDQHVKINGNEIKFSFKGKKGVYQNITLKSKRLAYIVKQCRDIPGKELFQYYDEKGVRHSVDSGMVNDYIKELCGSHFTAKDFRTWAGTLCALQTFRELGCCDTVTETKRKITEALDTTARLLGNTRTVCRKYYVHPVVVDHYTNKTIGQFFEQITTANTAKGLSADEQVLMEMLGKTAATIAL